MWLRAIEIKVQWPTTRIVGFVVVGRVALVMSSEPAKPNRSPLERLFQHMQLLIELTVLCSFCGDLAHSMQHSRVISATK